MMGWEKQTGYKLKPYSCAACGSSGEHTQEGPPDSYFAQGVDINWGDSLYLCDTCVRILGELRGMLDVDAVAKLKKERDDLARELEEMRRERDQLSNRVSRMLDGARARKEAKEAMNA
jgi:hypothetical protein